MTGWQPIASAPKDGTAFLGARFERDEWFGKVWWQPEFDAFIDSCQLMTMAPGWTFEDGSSQHLHSPGVPNVTHWMPLPPPPGDDG